MIVPERAAARQAAMKLKEPGGRPGAAGGPAPAVGTSAEVAAGSDQVEAPKEGKPRGKKVCSVIHATTIPLMIT